MPIVDLDILTAQPPFNGRSGQKLIVSSTRCHCSGTGPWWRNVGAVAPCDSLAGAWHGAFGVVPVLYCVDLQSEWGGVQCSRFLLPIRRAGLGTTIATNLVNYLAGKHQRVVILDMDRQRSAARWLSRRPRGSPEVRGAARHRPKGNTRLRSAVADCRRPSRRTRSAARRYGEVCRRGTGPGIYVCLRLRGDGRLPD